MHVYKQKDNVIVGSLARAYKQKTTLTLDLLLVYKTENNFAGISCKRREDNVTLGSLGHVRNIRKVNFCLDLLHVYEGEDSVTTGSLGHVKNRRKVDFCLDLLRVYERKDSVTTGSLAYETAGRRTGEVPDRQLLCGRVH